ncbi:MAG TPA: hypothetical protein DCL80_10455 [Balneola sp.]|jgi:hypothetical protein|nr:hypothetical protein [Balneola sp.]MAO77072.1 hypothetical protein [Balneola sp.]MBF64639.1 hypothetical protein [Balneola sp.]MBF65891.1 hypothetical protein [Balneola sp.]HAH51649.1 hypothetical protein [Balneola sp.]|tara:strand:+ start:43432 stop:43902 length:471 start_codon:yes stop_codon:yes gene_type:complete
MKNYILILIALLTQNVFSQSKDFDLNLILSVDDELLATNFFDMKLIQNKNNSDVKCEAMYVPGSLKLDAKCKEEFEDGPLYLVFTYSKYEPSGEKFVREYKLKLYNSWLANSYTIFEVFNMDKELNRSRFPSQINKEYIYEYSVPGTTFVWELDNE